MEVEDEISESNFPKICSVKSLAHVKACLFCCTSFEGSKSLKYEPQNGVGDAKESWKEHATPQGGINVCVRQLCGYLNITPTDKNMNDDFRVMLCYECAYATKKLSGLCRDLKGIKMWIGRYLEILTEKMTKASKSSEFDEKSVLKSAGGDGSSNTLLRKLIEEKGTLKVQNSKNRQVRGNRCTPDAVDQSSPPRKRAKKSRTIPKEPAAIELEMTMEVQVDGAKESGFDVTIGDGQERRLGPDSTPLVVKGHPCRHCRKVLTDASRLRLHTSNVHPELLLANLRADHVSHEDFRHMCINVLRHQPRKVACIKDGRQHVGCLHCPTTYSSYQYLKYHMIDIHNGILAVDLDKLQEDNGIPTQPLYPITTRGSASRIHPNDEHEAVADYEMTIVENLRDDSLAS